MSAQRAVLVGLASLVAALGTGCAHRFVTMDVRAVDTGLAREFTYEAKNHLFEATSPQGTLLKIWLQTKQVRVGSERRIIPPGCHGGLLYRRFAVGQSEELTFVTLCPRDGAAAGWQGWHVDLEQAGSRSDQHSLPPSAVFDIQPSASGDELLVSTDQSRSKVALPPEQVEVFRKYPELLGFAIISGVVPGSQAGKYEATQR